jgi:predicted P-loop ATPase
LRINEISERLIWKKKGEKEYRVMTDLHKNSIYLELKKHGKKISFEDLSKLLFSDFIKVINPLKDYILEQSKKYDGIDYIEKIAKTLEVDNSNNLDKWFKKWFVAMIANVFDHSKNTNHTCFVLSGEQGIFKTTWLMKLIPEDLSDFVYVGQIKPENKDTTKQLALRLLVIIDDQLHKINKNNQDDLKHLITLHPVTYRGLFKQFDNDYPRLASFCGSVNGKEFLNDLTGSRRFLSFHALSIDMEAMNKIDIG